MSFVTLVWLDSWMEGRQVEGGIGANKNEKITGTIKTKHDLFKSQFS